MFTTHDQARPAGSATFTRRPGAAGKPRRRTKMHQTTNMQCKGSPGAKRGVLGGGALSEEALASSRSVLSGGRGGHGVGLQQYFTAAPVAEFIRDVINPVGVDLPVLDPTAGDGALLAPHTYGFGIEIDRDHTVRAKYMALRGDVQLAYPLMKVGGVTFPRIVANPPFGLTWQLPGIANGKPTNSTVACALLTLDLLGGGGLAAMVCGTARLRSEVLANEKVNAATWAIVDITGEAFPGVKLPASIVFLCATPRDGVHIKPLEISCAVEDLHAAVGALIDAQTTHVGYVASYTRYSEAEHLFDALRAAYEERHPLEGPPRSDVRLIGRRLRVSLGALGRLVNDYSQEARLLARLNGQPPSYLALNSRDWRTVRGLAESGVIVIDEKASAAVEREIERARLILRPMYPVPVQMRLGFLDDLTKIECIQDDPERGFVAGESYALNVETQVQCEKAEKLVERRNGEHEIRDVEIVRRALRITIDDHTFHEAPEDITYLVGHFALPDPGDLGRDHPDELARIKAVLADIESEWGPKDAARGNPDGWRLKPYQLEDLARGILKRRFVLAHDMGLGKTCCQLLFAEACARLGYAKRAALFVAPQDLHPQWQREGLKFLGRQLEVIRTPGDAARVRRHVRDGATGMWLTHYEALSLIGTCDEHLPPVPVLPDGVTWASHTARQLKAARERTPEWQAQAQQEYEAALAAWQAERDALAEDDYDGHWVLNRRMPTQRQPADHPATLTSESVCPACRQPWSRTRAGWDGLNCGACGYTHRSRRVPSVASILSGVFKRGVICIDEISMIRGHTSRRSTAVRGLSAACRLGASGTPIANYVADCFWGLAWTLGVGSARFPYGYEDGPRKFEDDFAVISFIMGRAEDGKDHLRERRKVLPEVTNLSMLWRLLAMSVIRRRKEDTGEPIAEKHTHIVEVPAGEAQRSLHLAWVERFATFFAQRNPGHPLVEAGLVEKLAAGLGLLAKLQYAATLPGADPDLDWIGVEGVTSVTPALLRVLEIVERHVQQGDKVLVGSCLIETGPLIARMLAARGIRAAHITEHKAGKTVTKNPRVRAREVTQFVTGDVDVLCAGVQAVKLGHNLDTASVVVLFGLPWSHEAKAQFIDRVHRLTSKRPVQVYIVVTRGLIDTQKLILLDDKSAASDVALDGRLIDQSRDEPDWAQTIEAMRAAGVPITNDTVAEEVLYQRWLESLVAGTDTAPLPPRPAVAGDGAFAGAVEARPDWVLDVDAGEQAALFTT
jgi:hypothetical protein